MSASNEQLSIVDSHFHLWYCPGENYEWPTRDTPIGSSDITIDDYEAAIESSGVKAAVFIQVLNNSVAEIDWLHMLSKKHPIIKGVVGGIDISSPKVDETLGEVVARVGPLFVGVRHILDLEPDKAWLESDAVERGLKVVERHGLTFDLLLRPPIIKAATKLVEKFPNVKFVVDHIAKPYIKTGDGFNEWIADMAQLSRCPNVWCKISGLVTEANYEIKLQPEIFLPYVKHILEVFGTDRVMFGSDWPVCRLAGVELADIIHLATQILDRCAVTPQDLEKYFYRNACTFYGLSV